MIREGIAGSSALSACSAGRQSGGRGVSGEQDRDQHRDVAVIVLVAVDRCEVADAVLGGECCVMPF